MSAPTQSEQIAAIIERVRTEVLVMARDTATGEQLDLLGMPPEIRDVEVPHTARLYLARNLAALAEQRELSELELREARERSVSRAREGFPVGLLLHYWLRGVEVLWQRCVAAAQPGETEALITIASRLFALANQQVCAVADAHHETRTAIDRHDAGAATLAARLLLSGQDATMPAQQAGVALAPAYDVLAVALEPIHEESEAGRAAVSVARRRKVLRILSALEADGPTHVLTELTADGGHVLLPHADGDDLDVDTCRVVLELVASAAGADATGAAAFAATREEIPAAAEHASEVLRVARCAGMPPGLHDVASVPLGYQLSRPGPARDHLVRVLAPLDPHPELLDTVRTLLERDGDRGRAARALGVHPNTINNRLGRIQGLLGFDPVSTHGVVTLSAALTARQLSTTVVGAGGPVGVTPAHTPCEGEP